MRNVEKYRWAGQATDDQYGACGIPKAINMHSQYVIHIAFPQQELLHKGAPLLCYTFATL